MNTNFVDFGEVIMTPVIKDVENVIYHDDILEKIETFILNKNYMNIEKNLKFTM